MPASRTLLPTASSAHCTAAKKIFYPLLKNVLMALFLLADKQGLPLT
jgi:hypothetical protein